ncbi:MAG: AAA family ATPase [Opitutaceae bacterium]|nr:AAA family ATPase [Opitutaceae bacterium]
MPPRPSNSATTLTGVLERIIFLNEETHYTIAEFRPEGATEKVTLVGAMPGAQCGETLFVRGEWTSHAQHGAQFKVVDFKAELPSSVYGIRKYLGSGLVPGIGKVYANKIVDAFGTETFRILSEESARLRNVPGIGKVRAAAIKKAWDDQRALREIHIFLQTYGVTTSQCVKLVRHYGAAAKDTLMKEPYRVAREIDGIGFKTADRIAINLGFANDAAPRLDAGLLYVLDVLQEEGHTAVRAADLRDQGAQLLEAPLDRVEARLNALVSSGAIVCHSDPSGLPGSSLLQLPAQDRAENRIAAAIHRLLRVPSGLPPIKAQAAVEWAAKNAGFTFADLQRSAVLAALTNKVSILTGGPGTGKTTCLRALVEILKAKKARVHLAAPTGRAAQRLAESTGGFAQTLHRLLKFDPSAGGFTANENHPLATDFLIVDEASMLDSRLAAALLQAIPSRAHLLLVGDTDQLPSVGAGNVLQDLIAYATKPRPAPSDPESSEGPAEGRIVTFPVTRLSVIYRQKGQSQIVTTAHAINSGDPGLPPAVRELTSIQAWADLTFIVADSPEDCLHKTLALCSEHLPRLFPWLNPTGDVQVLAPMHKGVVGVASLNQGLQAALNPHGRGFRGPHGEMRPGDKVIQLRNNYDKGVFNGDIGSIRSLDTEEGTLSVDFDGSLVDFDRGELSDLAPAYAISIHKSQGSEYPVVVVPLLKAHFMMLQRNLLYTAITRGKKKVFLVGEAAAYSMAVRNSESKTRTTHLREKLLQVSAS